MRPHVTPAPSGPAPHGFVHQAAIYDTDEQLVSTVVPFLSEGAALGQPTLVGVGPREAELLHDALDDVSGVTFLPADAYAGPLLTLSANRDLLTEHTRSGPARIVGQIPPLQLETDWPGWIRYEAAVGQLLASLPVTTMCAYDARHAPDGVLGDVERAHPRLATGGGEPVGHTALVDPATLLTDRLRGVPDPLEDTRPGLALTDPPLATARDAVADLASDTDLRPEEVDDLRLAVTEILTNAYKYGRPVVTLLAWADAGRVVVTVTDLGAGPDDPLVGLVPPLGDGRDGGFGLWISHQVCDRVDQVRGPDGFTVRLTSTPRQRPQR